MVEFLRPTFVAVIGFAAVVGIGNLSFLRPSEFSGLSGLSPAELHGLDLSRVQLPRPGLTPGEVVRIQLAGLGDAKADGVGILQCYCLASPANRAATGPLERFGHMVRQGPYKCLGRPRALLVGRPKIRGDSARILVTLLDEQTVVQAFTFVLTRQQGGPLDGCWLTDGVFPASPPPGPAEAAAVPSA